MSKPADLPDGRSLVLPGRGTTFIREIAGPTSEPPLVLLHGWTVTSAMNFYAVMAPLAAATRRRVIAMDQRGHGRGIRPRALFRLEDCADDVAAMAAVLGLDRVVPIGYSMGGAVAQLVAHRHGDLAAGAVFCATAAHFASERDSPSAWDVLGPMLATGLTVLPPIARRRVLDRFLLYKGTELPDWMAEELRRNDLAMVAQAGLALGKFDARPWLDSLTMPTAVVRTTLDATVSPRRQDILIRSLGNPFVFDVVADHRAAVSAPEVFVPELVKAVAAVSQAHVRA